MRLHRLLKKHGHHFTQLIVKNIPTTLSKFDEDDLIEIIENYGADEVAYIDGASTGYVKFNEHEEALAALLATDMVYKIENELIKVAPYVTSENSNKLVG